jgi:hypothetical protein
LLLVWVIAIAPYSAMNCAKTLAMETPAAAHAALKDVAISGLTEIFIWS